jgi:hypothetical protein
MVGKQYGLKTIRERLGKTIVVQMTFLSVSVISTVRDTEFRASFFCRFK